MAKKRLLVVDDDRLMRAMLSDVLGEDYDVDTANDGEDALSHLDNEPYAAVISDQHMPKVEGVRVLEQYLERHPDTVRILVTSSEEISDIRDAINVARVHRFVQKPVHELELLAMVKGAIREGELERENARLVGELQQAIEQLQQREHELEFELNLRAQELREIMARLARSET